MNSPRMVREATTGEPVLPVVSGPHQPLVVPQLVSRIIVPGRYRRATGTRTSAGPNRNPPASRSRMAPNTLGPSIRGRHIHSMLLLGATRAVTSQSDRNAYSAIGGYD